MTEDDKYRVIAALEDTDKPAREIADDLDVSYGAVLKLKREYDTAKVNNTIDQLIDVDRLLLVKAGQQIDKLPNVDKAVTNLTQGLDGLDRLSNELQKTAIALNQKVNSLMLSVTDLAELELASNILCALQTAFLNKQQTQVNIQNNMGTPQYSQFLGDVPNA